jgi:hypothetical protein
MEHVHVASVVRTLRIGLLALVMTACSLGVDRDDLIGDFQIDYGYGVETLRLGNDGRYTQSFRLAQESTWAVQSGTWQFNSEPSPTVALHEAMQIDNGSGKPRDDYRKPVPGLRSLPVKTSFGTVSLVVDQERGLAMHKLAPLPPSDRKPNIIHLPPRNDTAVK